MSLQRAVIIVLLGIALLIQNTCPQGAAGKSSVAASCRTCPMKHHHLVLSQGEQLVAKALQPIHYPLYVLSVSSPAHTFGLAFVETASPLLIERYLDALRHELLRPPRA